MEAVISFPSHQQCHHHQQQYHQQQQHHLQQLIATASAAATDNTSAIIPPVSSSQTPVPTSKPIAEATSIEYTNETGQNNEQKQLTSDDDQNQRLTLPSENPVHSQSPSHLSLENHLPKEFLELYGDAIINSSNEHQPQQYFYSSPLIYSEPALSSSSNTTYSYAPALAGCYAFSEMAIPQIYADTTYRDNSQTGAISSNEEENDELNLRERIGAKAERNDSVAGLSRAATMNAIGRSSFGRMLSKGFTPRSSCLFQTDSQPSVATTAVGSSYIPNKQQSFSVAEIRDQHIQIQKKYRPSRKRHFTDPVDFEGILNIIGGCSWWQIWVYLLISLQQIPHAMFNLSVVYMMYQPDHWCQIPGLNQTNKDFKWTVEQTLNSSILYPRTRNRQREDPNFHSQCHYFDRGLKRFSQLGRMSLDEAEEAVAKEELPRIEKCTQWHYADDVMKKTIVTEWNLVCDDNFKRAHAHLFYSFGFLLGCLLGGYSSDRFGRKPTVIGFGILSSMFGLILPYATYFPMFLFIRFCGAVCNEAADLAAYVLCMEITGTRYRAMVGSLLQAPWAVGYATLALIAYFCKSWQSIQLITAGLHTISICLICVLPESPRWLIVNNRVDEAERYIRRACREPPFPFKLFSFNKSSLPCDLELVKHAEQRQWVRRDQRANIFHLLKSRALCMRTAIVCIVWIATALVYYGLIIALSDQSAPGRVLFSGNFFVNNAIAGAIELPTLLSCVYLMKYGRKRSQMFTLMAAAVFIFAAMGAISIRSQMVSLCLMLIGKIFIQGAFNILYIFTSELYPTVIRNSAVGFCSMIARFGSGVSSYIAILSDVTLAIVPMIIFSIFSLFAGVLVLLLPETRDQPLPDTLQDAVTFLKNKHEYECVGNLMNGFNQKFFGGKLSVSVMGLGNRDGGESTNCSNCGDTCTCGATEPDDQRTLVDVDADDVASTVSSVVTSNTAAAPPQSSSLPQRKRSETLNPAIMTVEQSVLPSIPEVPDYEHLQLQQRNSQQQQQHGSEMSNESEKKDHELLVDIGAEDNISGLVLNLDDHIAAESEDRLTALSLATPIGSADLASTPVRQRHSAGETGGPVKKVSVGTNDSFLLAALADDPVMPPPNKMSALKNRKSSVLPRPRSSNSATIDSAPFPTRNAAKVRFPVTLSPPPRPIISSREHSPSSREQEQSAALHRRPFLLGHRRCNSRE